MTPRVLRRGCILAAAILLCALEYLRLWLLARLSRRPVSSLQHARWMTFCGRLALRAMGLRWRSEGQPPNAPSLIVANHLSYLDIVIASAAIPCLFVAKSDIADWPVFGKLARFGGTIFVNRQSLTHAWDTAETMAERLREGVPVLFFPEGTSTDGDHVLRFHSALFEAAIQADVPITTAVIGYEVDSNRPERDLCWFGNEAFLPHLLRVLDVDRFTAVVRFLGTDPHPDRHTAAWRTHETITQARREWQARHSTHADRKITQ